MLSVRRVALGLVLVVVAAVGGCSVTDTPWRVTAVFDDSAGLFVGNDVGILGVPVGEVTEITPRGPVVEVELELSPDTSVPASAGAVVVSRSVATDRYVELTPAFGPGRRMADGARIGRERTRTPVEFDEVLASLNAFSEGLAGEDGDAEALRRLLETGALALDGRGQQTRETLEALAQGVGAFAEHRDDVTGSIRDLDQLTATLAANREVVDEFLVSLTDATDLLADERENFGGALRSLSRALRTLATFVRQNRAQLGSSLTGLTRVTNRLLRHQRDLAESIEVLPLTFQNTGNAIEANRLNVKLPPSDLSPEQAITDQLCARLPADACDQLGTDPDLSDVLKQLGARP